MYKLSKSVLSVAFLCGASLASPAKRFGSLLNEAAFPRYFGAALGVGHLQNASDHKFSELAALEFSGATPENEMKWMSIEPFQNEFNFTGGDIIRDFALEHGFKLRGHNLVWDSQLAPFVATLVGREAVLEAMTNHITKVVTHYRGQIFAWDVVNEPFNDDGTLASSPFFDNIGADYIPIALATARAADPHARLYLNDFNIEGINNKSDAMLALVQSLKKQNLIDGVGFESHFILDEIPSDLQANIQRFVDAGVEVAITELDVRVTLPVTAQDAIDHPKNFATVVGACKAVFNCVGITTWGITDLYSWIPGTFQGESFGLLWDDNYVQKPAFFSTLDTLNS